MSWGDIGPILPRERPRRCGLPGRCTTLRTRASPPPLRRAIPTPAPPPPCRRCWPAMGSSRAGQESSLGLPKWITSHSASPPLTRPKPWDMLAVSSGWAGGRRRRLSELAGDAREEAAELAFAAGRHADARRLNDQVLTPTRLARAHGACASESRAPSATTASCAYKNCEPALPSLATTPSATTHQLLERLRR
jgi:hypothetical protein